MSSTISVLWDPATTYKAIIGAGHAKTHLPLASKIVSGMMAGLFIAYGAFGAIYVVNQCPVAGPCDFLLGIVFSGALVFLVAIGAEEYSGNCMLYSMAVLARRVYWHEMVKNLAIVILSNFAGSIITSGILFGGGNSGTPGNLSAQGEIFCAVAAGKALEEPHFIFFRGVSANILICVAALLAIASKSMEGICIACIMPIAVFCASGFDLCTADLCFFIMATMLDCDGGTLQGRYWLHAVLSALGNFVGGAGLTFVYWHLIVRPSEEQQREVPHDLADRRLVPRSLPEWVAHDKKEQPAPAPSDEDAKK